MKVKDLVEVALLYVGVPAVTLYSLGFVGLFIQLWRDTFFPYYDFNMVWNAVAITDPGLTVRRSLRTSPVPSAARHLERDYVALFRLPPG